jgi:hypothetical protein
VNYVRLSELAKRASKKPDRTGVIVALGQTTTQYKVKWDDAKVPQAIHRDYLESAEFDAGTESAPRFFRDGKMTEQSSLG